MIGIYKIQNLINGKLYIGQSVDIEQRWKEHISAAKGDYYHYTLYKAMRKYGIENFSFSIIEECNRDELSEKEKYWIKFYNSYEEGYNSTLGGEGTPQWDRDLILSLWNEGLSSKDIIKKIGIKDNVLSGILQELNIPHSEIRYRGDNVKRKSIQQYDLKGNFIAEFSCPAEAAKQTNTNQTNLMQVARQAKEYKSANNFLWKYSDDERSISQWVERKKVIDNTQKKTVYQYDLSGNFIAEYPSTGMAAKAINTAQQNISAACRGKRKTAAGYIWRYEKYCEREL